MSAALFDTLHVVRDPEPHAPALNMAIDEALLSHASAPTLRIYDWDRSAVSFGCFGKLADVAARWPGRALVRRWTGGGDVPHAGAGEGDLDFTYTIIVPTGHPFAKRSPRETYREIHEVVAGMLDGTSLAAAVEPAAPGTAGPQHPEPCFENPVRHDVMRGGEKIAGAAQRRTRRGLLHQGSVQGAAATAILRAQLATALAGVLVESPLDPAVLDEATRIAAEKYAADEWMQMF